MQAVVNVSPQKHPFQGAFSIPGDKSITHRALILSAISNHRVCIKNALQSLDCFATLKAMQQMGVEILQTGEEFWVSGVGLAGLKAPSNKIDCGNSGTTMRLLTGLLAAQSFDSVLIGDASLTRRPMARVAKPLNAMGAKVRLSENNTAPIVIQGGQVLAGYQGQLEVSSSQVKSALQLAGLYARSKTKLATPYPCRDHTERMLQFFANQKSLDHGQKEALTINVPGDFSSASFFIVAATIVPGSNICLRQVNLNSTRLGLLHVLKKMGANITLRDLSYHGLEWRGDIYIRAAILKGVEVDAHWVPLMIDEFPILTVAAGVAKGETVFRGASELRKKESDRIAVMAENLSKLGVVTEVYEDGLRLTGPQQISGGQVESLGDHRIAMAMFILGLVATEPIEIHGTDCIATSFPTFFDLARQFGVQFEVA